MGVCRWGHKPAAHCAGGQLPGPTRQLGPGLAQTAQSPNPGTVQTQSSVRNRNGTFARAQLGAEGGFSKIGETRWSVHTRSPHANTPLPSPMTPAHACTQALGCRGAHCPDPCGTQGPPGLPCSTRHPPFRWASAGGEGGTQTAEDAGSGGEEAQAALCQGCGQMLQNAECTLWRPCHCALGLKPTHQLTHVLFPVALVAGVRTRWPAAGEPLGNQGGCWQRSDLGRSLWGGAPGILPSLHWLG